MKKHKTSLLVLFWGLLTFSSCLKETPETTLFYGHQQIPNINEYMPMHLLEAMGNENLYFGDNPPVIEGHFMSSSMNTDSVVLTPDSLWMTWTNAILTPQYFVFTDQHIGTAQMEFLFPRQGFYLERSSTENTYEILKEKAEHFADDSIAPSYFKAPFDTEVFRYAYIMGDNPFFTVYFYEVRDHYQHFQPLNAVVMSGKMASETYIQTDTLGQPIDTITRPYILNFKWGVESMAYFPENSQLENLNDDLSVGAQAYPGNIILFSTDTLRIGQYQP